MTSKLWYPGAIRQPQADNGAFTGGPPKGVLHSTESRFGAGWASFKPGTHSHFEVTAEPATRTVSVRQYYPIDQPSRALADGPLAVRTNRDSAIQVELGYQAAHAAQVPAWFWAGTAPLLRWIEDNAGVADHWATFRAYPAVLKRPVRFTAKQWDAFSGWCGHQHVPDGNSHGDPGAIPVDLLKRPPRLPAVSLAHMKSAWEKDRRRRKGLHPIQTRRVQRALGFAVPTGRWGRATRARFGAHGPTRGTLEALGKGRFRVVD